MHALEIDNEIAFQFTYFVTEMKAFRAMDRTDINRVAQNVILPLFKEVYGYSQLRNLDVGADGNFPGIDLADDEARVAIQVTSTPGLDKVKHTLEQFLKDRPEFQPPLAKRYDRLIIYILTEKQKTYSQESIDSLLNNGFPFVASEHVWDYTNLLADIQGLGLEKKEAVLAILKGQLGHTLSRLAVTGLIKVPVGLQTGYFVGREDFLAQVHGALAGGGVAQRIVILTGMGGIGKTQAALGYVLQYQGDYARVLWSSAESEAGFLDSLKSLAHALLPATQRVEGTDEVRAALARWMDDEANTDWLLVVDGADFQAGWTPARLKVLLPATKQGRLLVTSQYQDFSAFLNAKVLPLEALFPETAVAFVLRFARRESAPEAERAAAKEITGMLGGLPIALEQAAAYVRTTGLPFVAYRDLLRQHGLRMLPADFDTATDYRHTVQTVCRLAFEAVRDRSPAAWALLELVAFLSAESNCLQPITMLVVPPHGPLSGSLGAAQDPAWIISESMRLVGTLHNYSLLTADHEKATIRVHRVVQLATRDALTADERRARLGAWCSVLGFFLKGQNNSAHWAFIESWFAHARSVAEAVVTEGVAGEAAATFLEQISGYLEKRAQYHEARVFAARAVQIWESASSGGGLEHSLGYVRSLIGLAVSQEHIGEGDLAIAALDRSIDILRSNHPEELSVLAAALWNLAAVYLRRGEFARAEALLAQVLDDSRLRSAADRGTVSGALTGKAQIASKRQDYETAVTLTREAAAELAAGPTPDGFRLANAYNSLGVMLAKLGRLDEAQANYERALDLFRELLPDSHPLIANLENNLGFLYFRRGVYGKALTLIFNSIPRLAQGLGDQHPTTLQAMRNYNGCVDELKKHNIAVVHQSEIDSGQYQKEIDGNTIGIIVITPVPAKDQGDSP